MLFIRVIGLLGAAVSAYPQLEVISTDAVSRSGRRFVSECQNALIAFQT